MKYIFSILIFFYSSVNAANFYVDQAGGDDSHAGTSPATAWQTLGKATGHTYGTSDSLFFKRDGVFVGKPQFNHLIWVGTYGSGANPIFDGFTTLATGSWVNNGGNVYAIYCPTCSTTENTVTLDGVLQTVARSPNTGFTSFTTYISSTKISGTGLTGTPSYVGTKIVTRSTHYTLDRATITVQGHDTVTFDQATTCTTCNVKQYFLQNNDAFLDQAGEWTWNSSTDTLKMYLPGGPSGHVIQASVVDTMYYSSGGTRTLDNLHFRGGNIINILYKFGTNNTIQYCVSELTGGSAIFKSGETNFTEKYDTLADALSDGSFNQNPITSAYVGHNYIHRIGMISGMGNSGAGGTYEAINCPSPKSVIEYNIIDSIGYNGIYSTKDSMVIQNNIITNVCMIKDDGGAIYSWDASSAVYTNPGRIINNICAYGFQTPGGLPNTDSSSFASGIYIDAKRRDILVDGNICYGFSSNGFFDHGDSITITNNQFYGNSYAQVQIAEIAGLTITGINFQHNLVNNSTTSQRLWTLSSVANDLSSFGVINNDVYNLPSDFPAKFYTKSSVDAGIFRTLATWQSSPGYDANSTINLFNPSLNGGTVQWR